MSECKGLVDIAILQGCAQLTSVNLSGCADISSLATRGALQRVGLRGCPLISDIAPLASCSDLEYLQINLSNERILAQKAVLKSSCPKLDL